MENSRFRGRKRYCCYYCNTFFYQVDSWQRHNRKHTGVEIECDDCGEMCSDHFELKAHQQLCEAYRVYSDGMFMQDDHVTRQTSAAADKSNGNSNVHETPDSTSKQESGPDNDDNNEDNEITVVVPPSNHKKSKVEGGIIQEDHRTSDDKDNIKNSELDDLIGDDRDQSGLASPEDVDTDTEALIGIDETVGHMTNNEIEPKQVDMNDSSIGIDPQIIIKVESALNEGKENCPTDGQMTDKEHNNLEIPMFINRPSPVGSSTVDSIQALSMDNSDMNKKYQPYFCKNCGARFTRKDSVTRHLKKGTCSGKSAIVCNICGKVFSEMFELQDHFKIEHKNVVFTPALVHHRSIHPRGEEQPHYPHYPPHYVVPEQQMVSASRAYISQDQPYRPMPPGLQAMFYGNQSTFVPRPGYPPPPRGPFHEHIFPTRPLEVKYTTANHVGKDMTYVSNPRKLFLNRNEDRKREYHEFRDHESHEEESVKIRKLDVEPSNKHAAYHNEKSEGHKNINLSEYTNNAMSSKQYYDNRFTKTEKQTTPTTGKEEPPRIHQCKVCGLEFPRFEYLLTHLRKHKEKSEIVDSIDDKKDPQHSVLKDNIEGTSSLEVYVPRSLNDSNSTSSEDNNDGHHQKPHFVMSQPLERPPVHTHEQIPIIMQKHPHYNVHHPVPERYMHHHEQVQNYPAAHTPISKAPIIVEGPMEAITPGVDGKFRPFICENCGQRFTRKDSLVRHAKKQTCFEEVVDLKCKHCDKTFRYNKCLAQHQELVHGITQDELKHPVQSEDEESESDKSEKIDSETKHKLEESNPVNRLHQDSERMKISPYPPTAPQYSRHDIHEHQLPSQVHAIQQLSPPKFIPPNAEERLKIQDSNQNSGSHNVSNQESQYIGYCMLPRPFQCEYCGDRFAHRHSLKRHVRRHLGIGIPCHDCGKLYRDQSEWRRHQRSIHNRYYEKSDVPSRMSFRDGVEQGLIGIVPRSDYENPIDNDDSDSGSDEEVSMTKSQPEYNETNTEENPTTVSNHHSLPMTSSHHSLATSSSHHSLPPSSHHSLPPSSHHSLPPSSHHSLPPSSHHSLPPSSHHSLPTSSHPPFIDHLAGYSFKSKHIPVDHAKMGNEKSKEDREEKPPKVFSFNSHTAGDKDSRKSLLDLYLCSPQSDGEYERNNNKVETHI